LQHAISEPERFDVLCKRQVCFHLNGQPVKQLCSLFIKHIPEEKVEPELRMLTRHFGGNMPLRDAVD
jgi:hypothetical protein